VLLVEPLAAAPRAGSPAPAALVLVLVASQVQAAASGGAPERVRVPAGSPVAHLRSEAVVGSVEAVVVPVEPGS
jgi:hypothetical protein